SPIALAQKPPAPAPGPGPAPSPAPPPPGRTPGFDPSVTQPVQPNDQRISFLFGHVKTDDGSPIPTDMLIERVCNARVRQQVYASSQGDFTMQLGAVADSFIDATAEPSSQYSEANKNATSGIPKHELVNCDLRASASGFRPSTLSLFDLSSAFSNMVDVGAILVHRAKAKGATVSANSYKVPAKARKAFEQGFAAQKSGKLADAQQYFQRAVEIYPKYVIAWFQLGSVLQKENDTNGARKAFTEASTIDSKYLPAFLSLSILAYKAENWQEVRELTAHILDLDPLNYARVRGDILDLDFLNYADAYFYNAVANYKLNHLEDAEKSAIK